jgi:hypothetical protein
LDWGAKIAKIMTRVAGGGKGGGNCRGEMVDPRPHNPQTPP